LFLIKPIDRLEPAPAASTNLKGPEFSPAPLFFSAHLKRRDLIPINESTY
jgi:hypothetical protein